jgi:hypothetical protein
MPRTGDRVEIVANDQAATSPPAREVRDGGDLKALDLRELDTGEGLVVTPVGDGRVKLELDEDSEATGGGAGTGTPAVLRQQSIAAGSTVAFRDYAAAGGRISVTRMGVFPDGGSSVSGLAAEVVDLSGPTVLASTEAKRKFDTPLVEQEGPIDLAFRINNTTSNSQTASAVFVYSVAGASAVEGPDPGSSFDPDIMEDWERSSPLDDYAGGTGSASIIDSPVENGDHALDLASGAQLRSSAGLDRYPERGDVFEVYLTPDAGEKARFLFGLQDGSNHYAVELDEPANTARLLLVDGGSESTLADATEASIVTDDYNFVEVRWGDPTIQVATGGVSVSADDGTYDSGGLGWEAI